MKKKSNNNVCVIIPCYKVSSKIFDVLNSRYLNQVDRIVIVDDKCPEKTGKKVTEILKKKSKVKVLMHKENRGVGGATITGFKYALKNKFKIVIKIDGDGQHKLHVLKKMIDSLSKNYDFSKGYRNLNYNSYLKHKMPLVRLIGAVGLTFLTRINTGKYDIKDPCHGLIGFQCKFLKKINLDEIQKDYLFEQDIIFKVVKLKAQFNQIKNEVIYDDENSSLNPISSIIPFLFFHIKNLFNFR